MKERKGGRRRGRERGGRSRRKGGKEKERRVRGKDDVELFKPFC